MSCGFGYCWDQRLMQRNTGVLCPEKPQRLQLLAPNRILDAASDVATFGIKRKEPHILLLAHDSQYIAHVKSAPERNRLYLDAGDTRVTRNTFDQALLSASAGCHALDEIFGQRLSTAFCAIRPPGHHANRQRAMGFCVFNNAAIAARYAQATYGIKSVLIVDWDIHPGNGTQEIFWEDPSVFVLSLHQSGHFPQSGREDLIGQGAGQGFNRNVAFPPGTNATEFLNRFEKSLTEVVDAFRPEMVVISAGFDAHRGDPASKMNITETDYTKMTEMVLRVTTPFTGGKLLSLLEGGYHIATRQASVRCHCQALAQWTGVPVAAEASPPQFTFRNRRR